MRHVVVDLRGCSSAEPLPMTRAPGVEVLVYSSPGGEVRVEDMRHSYWVKRFNGARRAELDTLAVDVSTRDPVRGSTRP